MSPDEVRALLAGAAVVSSAPPTVLRHWHVAVVSETAACGPGVGLAEAAVALGASVVRLRPSVLRLDDRRQLRETASLLGRLYDLIGCEGLALPVRAGLCCWAGVPVLNDVAAASHPTRILADLLLMQELARRPADTITLGLFDAPGSATFQAWRLVSVITGLHLVYLGPAQETAPAPRWDYRLDPPLGATDLMPLVAAGEAFEGLAERQHDAHRRLLQSMLMYLSG